MWYKMSDQFFSKWKQGGFLLEAYLTFTSC